MLTRTRTQGRMLHDVFLHPGPADAAVASSTEPPSPSSSSFYLDHPSIVTPTLRKYLKRHILRSKVKLGPAGTEGEEKSVWVAWRNRDEVLAEGGKEEGQAREWLEGVGVGGAGMDERVEGMGWRWVGKLGQGEGEFGARSFFVLCDSRCRHALTRLVSNSPRASLHPFHATPLPPASTLSRRARRSRRFPSITFGGEFGLYARGGLQEGMLCGTGIDG